MSPLPPQRGSMPHYISLRPVLLFCSAIRCSMLSLFVPQIFVFIFEVSQPPTDDTDSSVTVCIDRCVKL